MPHVEEHTFGPGSLESLVLKTWVSKVNGSETQITARLEGTYTVYCGEGWTHEVRVKESESGWNSESFEESTRLFQLHNFMDEVDTKYEIANDLVNYALEDWSDPCEVTEL